MRKEGGGNGAKLAKNARGVYILQNVPFLESVAVGVIARERARHSEHLVHFFADELNARKRRNFVRAAKEKIGDISKRSDSD